MKVTDGRLRRKERGFTLNVLQGISLLMAIVITRYREDFHSIWLQLWC